jgi:hypothetical protein
MHACAPLFWGHGASACKVPGGGSAVRQTVRAAKALQRQDELQHWRAHRRTFLRHVLLG